MAKYRHEDRQRITLAFYEADRIEADHGLVVLYQKFATAGHTIEHCEFVKDVICLAPGESISLSNDASFDAFEKRKNLPHAAM
jgi:hypothetical protein